MWVPLLEACGECCMSLCMRQNWNSIPGYTLMAAVSLEALGAHLRSIREHADARRAAAPSVVRQSKCEQAAAHRHPHG